MSLIYWLSKFNQEAMLLEVFFIGLLTACYFGYLLFQKRRYGVAKKNIPDHIVRAFLIELISSAEGFKNQLFGQNLKIQPGLGLSAHEPSLQAAPMADLVGASSSSSEEVNDLKAKMAASLAKQAELLKTVAALTAEKAALEAKAAAAPAATAAAEGAAPVEGGASAAALTEATDKINKLESKLAEYEVIEDDLANLKRYQQENKQLRAQLEALQGGGAAAPAAATAAPTTTPAPATAEPAATATAPATADAAAPATAAATPAAAPPPEASPIAAAEASITDTQAAADLEGLANKVEESLAAPASPAVAKQPPAGASVADTTPAAAETKPSAPAAEAAAPPPAEKSDADLLNEFERMLSS